MPLSRRLAPSLDSTWEAKCPFGTHPSMQLLTLFFPYAFFGEAFVLVSDGLPLVL